MTKGILVLSGSLLVGAVAYVADVAAIQPGLMLKDAYRDAFLIGTAVNEAIVAGTDSAGLAIVVRQFNTITNENVLKAERVNPRPGVYDFGLADAFVSFGDKHRLFIVGHTLVWHNQ